MLWTTIATCLQLALEWALPHGVGSGMLEPNLKPTTLPHNGHMGFCTALYWNKMFIDILDYSSFYFCWYITVQTSHAAYCVEMQHHHQAYYRSNHCPQCRGCGVCTKGDTRVGQSMAVTINAYCAMASSQAFSRQHGVPPSLHLVSAKRLALHNILHIASQSEAALPMCPLLGVPFTLAILYSDQMVLNRCFLIKGFLLCVMYGSLSPFLIPCSLHHIH